MGNILPLFENEGFVCAADGRQAASEEEVIHIPEEEIDEDFYKSFTRSKKK